MAEQGRTGDPAAEASRRALRRILGGLLGCCLFVLALLLVSAPTRLAARTLELLPSFFASLPGAPIDWTTPAPVREVVDLEGVEGYVRAHVYRPRHGRHAALVLSLGINPAPPDDPRVVRLLDGLSRAGLVAVLVESEALNHDLLSPDLPRALVESVQFTAAQSYVRSDRVGLLGFSIGGSLALLAAADPALQDRLRLVEAFGSYQELADAVVSVATHTLDDDGRVRRWQPRPEAERHLANALIGSLGDPEEAELLRRWFVDGQEPAPDVTQLSDQAATIVQLLSSRNRAAGQALLPRLPALAQQDFSALSPLGAVPQIRATLFIMYDVEDPLLPFTGSRAICRAAQTAHKRPYCSRFAIFQHVDPSRRGNPLQVGHDLIELYLHAFALLRRLQ